MRPTMSANLPKSVPGNHRPSRPLLTWSAAVPAGPVPRQKIVVQVLLERSIRYRSSVRAIRRFTVRPVLPGPLEALGELAGNLRWSWHPPTQAMFESIDPELWARSKKDPVRLLGLVPSERLAALAADDEFLGLLAALRDDLTAYLTGDRWYQAQGDDKPRAIGYFSPEFGITAVLPQYSGGLGILAGDHLKAASDLGVPLVGVGLLYQYGYFKQQFSREGWQLESYPVLDPDGLPITLLREEDGTPAQVRISVPGEQELAARIFVA